MWLNAFSDRVVQVPLALVLARMFELGPHGVFVAILVGELLLALTGVFRTGRWKRVAI